jgi:hypothetical protein
MSVLTDLRKNVTTRTPVYAVVGVTDLAVEKVRQAQKRATSARSGLERRADEVRVRVDVKALPTVLQVKAQEAQERAQQLPTDVLTKALEVAGRAEEAYEGLSARGKGLVERVAQQAATQDLLHQGKHTISRGRSVVTTVRRGSKDTRTAAKAAVTTARRDVAEVADDAQASVAKRTTTTKRAAKRTTTTAKKRTARAKSEVKATATTARKTASAATRAAEAAADKIGNE